jgi:uncharacterized OB-fold protein
MSEIAIAVPGDHIHITTDPWTEKFWDAAKDNKLTAAQCGACGHFRMPPTPYCPECRSQDTRWPELSGGGTVYSFAICNRSPFPDLPDFTYVPVVVDLDGAPGARLVTNLVNIDPAAVRIGMKVKVAFNPINDGWKLPIFEPATD